MYLKRQLDFAGHMDCNMPVAVAAAAEVAVEVGTAGVADHTEAHMHHTVVAAAAVSVHHTEADHMSSAVVVAGGSTEG